MSRKGHPLDNSACEGFDRLRNEMPHNHDQRSVTVKRFRPVLTDYIEWHDSGRIRHSLDSKTPTNTAVHLT